MPTNLLKDEQWTKIVAFLRQCPGVYVGNETTCRRFVEAVIWIDRSGAPWRFLPEKYGNWNSIYKRFARWCDKAIWSQLHQYFGHDPDLEYLIVDSTVIRAHPCATGAPKAQGGQAQQALGRSRGGFSTKIHLSVDGLGNSLRFKLTAGQRHDITQAEALVTGYDTDYVIADKSYDADAFRQLLSDQGAIPVIPPRANRKHLYDYDTHLYKERHLVECFINKIKQFRRVFSRFEKLASRYLGFLNLSAALIWLR